MTHQSYAKTMLIHSYIPPNPKNYLNLADKGV